MAVVARPTAPLASSRGRRARAARIATAPTRAGPARLFGDVIRAAESALSGPEPAPPTPVPESGRTVLVTGGLGFIGSHVTEALLARGDRVVVVDDLNGKSYSPDVKVENRRLLTAAARAAGPGRLAVITADVAERRQMEKAFLTAGGLGGQIDNVCHLAARAGVRASLDAPEDYIRANVTGTTVLLDLSCQAAVKHFVYASSSSVYGGAKASGPGGPATSSESDATDCQLSPYAATKRCGELMAACYHGLHGLPTAGLRFFTVYGPRGRADMAPLMFVDRIATGQQIEMFGDGGSFRDYTYVGDVVAGVVAALDRPDGNQVYNLGAGTPVRLRDFVAAVEAAVGRAAVVKMGAPRKGDVEGTWADISKARAALGYEPKVGVAEGLAATAAWHAAYVKTGKQLYAAAAVAARA